MGHPSSSIPSLRHRHHRPRLSSMPQVMGVEEGARSTVVVVLRPISWLIHQVS